MIVLINFCVFIVLFLKLLIEREKTCQYCPGCLWQVIAPGAIIQSLYHHKHPGPVQYWQVNKRSAPGAIAEISISAIEIGPG